MTRGTGGPLPSGRGRRGGRRWAALTAGEHGSAEVMTCLREHGFTHPGRVAYEEGVYVVEGFDDGGRPFRLRCDARTLEIELLT